MATRRNIIIAAVVLAAALLLYWGFRPQPLRVETATVSRGPLAVSVTEEGKTRIRERYVVASPVNGFAERIELEEGDRVAAGASLLRIESVAPTVLDRRSRAEAQSQVSAAQAALEAAETRVRAAEADAELAEAERRRIERLFETNAVSRAEYDRIVSAARRSAADLRSATAEAEVARYRLQAARDVLRYSASEPGAEPPEEIVVRSPIDGNVLDVVHESEGVVTAGQHLLTLGDPANLEVEVELLSADAVQLAPGMPVKLHRWGGDRRSTITITRCSSTPRAEIFVNAAGSTTRTSPSSAAFRREDQWYVFVVEDDRAALRPVRLGRRGQFQVQLVEGVEPGEALVLYPDDEVEDGRRLQFD